MSVPQYLASKWLDVACLLSPSEMESLFADLGNFWIYNTSQVVEKPSGEISKEAFLKNYALYVETLKGGKELNLTVHRPFFSSAFTVDPSCVYLLEAGRGWICRVQKPVVQLQPHSYYYSKEEGKFRSMVFGTGSVSFGIQFSFPQLFFNHELASVENPLNISPNGLFFKALQRWIRYNTVPATFVMDGKKMFVPFRVGKKYS